MALVVGSGCRRDGNDLALIVRGPNGSALGELQREAKRRVVEPAAARDGSDVVRRRDRHRDFTHALAAPSATRRRRVAGG